MGLYVSPDSTVTDMIPSVNILHYSLNQLIFVLEKCSVFFAVEAKHLNIVWSSCGFQIIKLHILFAFRTSLKERKQEMSLHLGIKRFIDVFTSRHWT